MYAGEGGEELCGNVLVSRGDGIGIVGGSAEGREGATGVKNDKGTVGDLPMEEFADLFEGDDTIAAVK
ncbi:hypothetical protein ACCS53_39535, partial [Rhizobium ruizarguesonis]